MKNSKEFVYPLLMMFFITFSIFLLDSHFESVVSNQIFSDKPSYTVVIDAGHGGLDSGKVGVDGTLEKDVNLIIAKKLENLLKSADINVIMVLTDDVDVFPSFSMADMITKGSKVLNLLTPNALHKDLYQSILADFGVSVNIIKE
jgi:N-acetylmuramoyl-L-alanine amidase